MKRRAAAALSLLLVLCFILSSCSLPSFKKTVQNSTLKVGVESGEETFNPFYCDDYDSSLIMPQIFETVLCQSNDGRFQKLCGNITYELLDDGKVKYTVSIDENVRFSDGTYATVDDIIFYYYLLADATYDGPESNWYSNDIQGLKAYYYDDKDYASALDEIKSTYSDSDEREEHIKEYIKSNYSDGISVSEISGIKKVNDHICTITFNSVNYNAVSQINALVIPKSVYGAGYVKGKADIVKNNAGNPVGSGPYVYSAEDEKSGTLTLKSNAYYHGGENGFDTLEFVDLTVNKLTAEGAVTGKKVDVCEMQCDSDVMNKIGKSGTACILSDADYYNSVTFNCEKLSENLRRGIMCLTALPDDVKSAYGDNITYLYRPLSVRFFEYPYDAEKPYYENDSDAASKYFGDAGYTSDDGSLVNEDGEKLTLKICCNSEEDTPLGKTAASIASSLGEAGISAEVTYADDSGYKKSLKEGSADLWVGPVYDNNTSDKYKNYYSSLSSNYSGIDDEELDSQLKSIRKDTDYGSRKTKFKKLLDYVMKLAVEYPLYQLKNVTVFNTDVIDSSCIPDTLENQDCRYLLRELKPVD